MTDQKKSKENNPMRKIRIEKLTLNIGAGKDQSKLEKGMKLLKNITGITPVKTTTNKRIPGWGLRPGLPIGCKITMRKKLAEEMFKRLIEAKDKVLPETCAENNGKISFGIHEYIDIPKAEYDPEIGIMGLQVCLTLERPGFRVKKRKKARTDISKSHKISKADALDFLKKEYNINIGEKS